MAQGRALEHERPHKWAGKDCARCGMRRHWPGASDPCAGREVEVTIVERPETREDDGDPHGPPALMAGSWDTGPKIDLDRARYLLGLGHGTRWAAKRLRVTPHQLARALET